MKQIRLFILFLISTIGFAQNEANIWYFGNNAGLDFNNGVPVALTDGQMATLEGCASIANNNGQLQFYTDGSTVWNRNHSIMANGTGLKGHFSSTQSAIIVPLPSSNTQYVIFTVDDGASFDGLNYSLVDMSLNGGLGEVTLKNVQLIAPTLEKVTAVKHANGTDIWVITHERGSDAFYAYLVTSTGVQSTPVITNIGFSYSGISYSENAGYIKVSPNGQRLAMAFPRFSNGLQLFDFDNTSGMISNHINVHDVPGAAQPYGIEFSLSGDILYVTGSGGVAQFNVTLATGFQILSSVVFLSNNIANSNWGAMQLAPDGKIYITRRAYDNTPDIHTLSVINNPDVLGAGCDFQLDTISLGTGIAQAGLPQFIQSFFLVGITTQNTCLGNATQFQANISESYDAILWDFGDGNSSSLETPSHTYTTAGTYTVTATVTSGINTTTDAAEVIIYEQPIAHQPSDILICDDNNDGFFEFDLTTQNTTILNGQSNAVFDIKYYASINDFNSGNEITTPDAYANITSYAPQTIIASVRNLENNECEDITTFTIQVFESPTPNTNIPNISACDNTSVGTDDDGIILFDLTQNETAILNGQSETDFSIAYFTDAGFTNEIQNPNSYQNTSVNEVIYVRVVNNNNVNCQGQTTFNIEVFQLPSVTPMVELKQCDDDLDGFSIFNLTEVINEISVNAANETISFYESLADAENENSPITNPISYTNETVSTDTIWARIENTNGCFSTSQINLTVSTTQIPNTFTRDFYKCDDAINGTTNDGISAFDFSTVNSEIQALFPSGQQLIISYYRNQSDALTEQNAITDISNYRNIGYPTTQTIYIRVDSALDNDCLGLGHHITLHIETVPVANTLIIPEECDADGDGMYEFDTSTIENTLLNGQTNVQVSYIDENGNTLPSPLPNPFITASQTITARVTNSNSLDTDGACYDETSIVFTVEAAAIAHTIPSLSTCDTDGDSMATFDTSTIENTVLNGQSGMIVTYTDENGNALPSPLPNPFETTSQTITVRVENSLNTGCFDETSVEFVVYEMPTAFPIENDIVCDDISNDGEATFILSNYNSQILNGQSNSTFEVFYFESMMDAENNTNSLPNNYILTSNTATIYARIHHRNNTDCYHITSFQIGISFFPIANQPNDLYICDEEENDGIVSIQLSNQNISIFNGQSATENSITYHMSASAAESGLNALTSFFENTTNPQTIFARLENNNHPNCYTTTSFTINVITQPILTMSDVWSICENESINIVADAGFDEYIWSTGETTQTITVDEAGIYELTVANIDGGTRCEASKTITVFESTIATILEIEKTDWTQNNNTITVQVEGNGDYEYSIDGIHYQDENVFSNLLIDDYLVHVRDKNGCGIVTEEVFLLYYPNFFTPNADGYNDTWQLLNASKEPFNKIYIFDRFGKIIKELKPNNIGWDGTYKGNPMPSADYWFLVERQNGKQYKGNFSLKR